MSVWTERLFRHSLRPEQVVVLTTNWSKIKLIVREQNTLLRPRLSKRRTLRDAFLFTSNQSFIFSVSTAQLSYYVLACAIISPLPMVSGNEITTPQPVLRDRDFIKILHMPTSQNSSSSFIYAVRFRFFTTIWINKSRGSIVAFYSALGECDVFW